MNTAGYELTINAIVSSNVLTITSLPASRRKNLQMLTTVYRLEACPAYESTSLLYLLVSRIKNELLYHSLCCQPFGGVSLLPPMHRLTD
jgi:hypothetical protein